MADMEIPVDGQTEETAPAEKQYNGSISLRVPKSIHRSLVIEAQAEGVSLNQLILAKISVSLYDMTRVKERR
jgi:predicted HicB family RNase H-like nuclease